MSAPFQVMPSLTTEEFTALLADVAERGIVVPVVVDQHGRVLDGHNRREIADRLGIDCPTEVRHVVDEEDARQTALALNLTRRHLSREQRRDLIARECESRPGDSDRAIARRFGCSPSTVGAVRRRDDEGHVGGDDEARVGDGVSNLDTLLTEEQVAEFRALTDKIGAALDVLDVTLVSLPRLDAIRLLTNWWRGLEELAPGDEDFLGPVRRHIYQPRLDLLLEVVA